MDMCGDQQAGRIDADGELSDDSVATEQQSETRNTRLVFT
jgi:hypothetical protein